MGSPGKNDLSQADLRRWRLINDFQQRLEQAAQNSLEHPSWSNPKRLLGQADYLSLFLFGLLNPVVRTMRGLCAASDLQRVREEVCSRPVSLGSFSEAQSLLDPEILRGVFGDLAKEVQAHSTPQAGNRRWSIQDSSLFNALPRMHWALWRRQGKRQSQVRLHLSLALENGSPSAAVVTTGRTCERAAWKDLMRAGDAYIADRYYGEDYQLLRELDASRIAFVVRLREEAVVHVEEELPLSSSDEQAQVLDDASVHLGCKRRYRAGPFRLVRVQAATEVLLLLTNLGPQELTAAEIALLYKQRWEVELFFRWIKYILGCRHWLAESESGTAVQLYLALIGALLLQLYTGQRPNRRMFEMIQFYLLGLASLDELSENLDLERSRLARKKS